MVRPCLLLARETAKKESRPGGCGSFYAIQVVDKAFEGLNKVKQHQLINSILKDEVARWQYVVLQHQIIPQMGLIILIVACK